MNHKLAREEFRKFKDELSKLSFQFPVNEERVDSAYNKCTNLLDTLYKMEIHSFRSQMAGLGLKNIGAKPMEKLSRLRDFVDNIIDDLETRERVGDQPKPLDAFIGGQFEKNLAEHRRLILKLDNENSQWTDKYEELSRKLIDLNVENAAVSDLYDALDKQYTRTRFWLILMGACFFTYLNYSYPAVLKIGFNWKWFLLAEGIFVVPFLIYRYKKIPKWTLIVLGLLLLVGLIIFLIRRPDWEKEFVTMLWALVGTLLFALITSFLKSKKIDI